MLADAISAETFKLTKNWRTSFFAFLFLPLAGLLVGLLSELWLEDAFNPNEGGPSLPDLLPFDFAQAVIGSIQQAANPLTILFCLIGAAVIFAGEYRWETWRLMIPRNTRVNHLFGKVLVYAAACGLSLFLGALLGLMSGLTGALADGQRITGAFDGETALQALSVFGVGWLHLLQAGAVAAIAGVLTRSILAALMVPLGLGLAQSILQALTSGTPPVDMEWWRPFLMPSLAADVLKTASQPALLPQMAMPEGLVWASIAAFLTWIIVGYGGALTLFLKQDLSKE